VLDKKHPATKTWDLMDFEYNESSSMVPKVRSKYVSLYCVDGTSVSVDVVASVCASNELNDYLSIAFCKQPPRCLGYN